MLDSVRQATIYIHPSVHYDQTYPRRPVESWPRFGIERSNGIEGVFDCVGTNTAHEIRLCLQLVVDLKWLKYPFSRMYWNTMRLHAHLHMGNHFSASMCAQTPTQQVYNSQFDARNSSDQVQEINFIGHPLGKASKEN